MIWYSKRPGQGWREEGGRGGSTAKPPGAAAGSAENSHPMEPGGQRPFVAWSSLPTDRILTFPASAIPGPNLISHSIPSSSSSLFGLPGWVRGVRCPEWIRQGPGSSSSAQGAWSPMPSSPGVPGGLATAGRGQAVADQARNFFEMLCCAPERCYNSNSITVNGAHRPRSWKVGN